MLLKYCIGLWQACVTQVFSTLKIALWEVENPQGNRSAWRCFVTDLTKYPYLLQSSSIPFIHACLIYSYLTRIVLRGSGQMQPLKHSISPSVGISYGGVLLLLTVLVTVNETYMYKRNVEALWHISPNPPVCYKASAFPLYMYASLTTLQEQSPK